MCKISDKIKLCSCNNKPYDKLASYWIISKLKEDCFRIGEVVSNPGSKETNQYNRELLLTRLNNKDLFDFDYEAEEMDELTIYIKSDKPVDEYIHYRFIFKKGKWTENGGMEWMITEEARGNWDKHYGYATHLEGKIENASL